MHMISIEQYILEHQHLRMFRGAAVGYADASSWRGARHPRERSDPAARGIDVSPYYRMNPIRSIRNLKLPEVKNKTTLVKILGKSTAESSTFSQLE